MSPHTTQTVYTVIDTMTLGLVALVTLNTPWCIIALAVVVWLAVRGFGVVA